MTIIVWRAGVMACDSCWASNGTQTVSMIKIKRLSSGALLGSAGENDSREMERLLDKIKHPDKLPTRQELIAIRLDYEGLIAFPRGGVWMIASGKVDEAGYADDDEADMGVWPAATMGGYAACGSGGDYALAAMDAGATARQAVEIACKRNINCRPPVHVRKLFDVNNPVPGKRHGRNSKSR
jgi:hypothetical protein